MFSAPSVNLIVSDEGFSVEILGRTGLLYREGTKVVRVDSEVQMGPSGMLVIGPSIRRWESPDGDQSIDDTTRDRILENIRAAFRFTGFEVDVAR